MGPDRYIDRWGLLTWFRVTGFCGLHYSAIWNFFWDSIWAIRFPQPQLSRSGNTKSDWGFYFSDCLRGNYIKPNRNLIGVWDDKWRPWITALPLLYLELGEINFTTMLRFSFLQIAYPAADMGFDIDRLQFH